MVNHGFGVMCCRSLCLLPLLLCDATMPPDGGRHVGLLRDMQSRWQALDRPSAKRYPLSCTNKTVLRHCAPGTGLDPEDPAYLEVALAVADLHVQADDAAAAHAVMQAVHAALQQVSPDPIETLQT